MKIELINCKHSKSAKEIAVCFDETINDDIIKRFNNKYKGNKGIWLSKIEKEESVFTIKVDKPNTMDRYTVVEKDIKFINEKILEIKEGIEKEEADHKAKRKEMLETAAESTGLDLDNSEE